MEPFIRGKALCSILRHLEQQPEECCEPPPITDYITKLFSASSKTAACGIFLLDSVFHFSRKCDKGNGGNLSIAISDNNPFAPTDFQDFPDIHKILIFCELLLVYIFILLEFPLIPIITFEERSNHHLKQSLPRCRGPPFDICENTNVKRRHTLRARQSRYEPQSPPPVDYSKDIVEFGAKVRYFREREGLSLDEMADRLGTDKSALSRIENGERSPRYDTILKIVDVLCVTPANLSPERFSDEGLAAMLPQIHGRLLKLAPAKRNEAVKHIIAMLDGLLFHNN